MYFKIKTGSDSPEMILNNKQVDDLILNAYNNDAVGIIDDMSTYLNSNSPACSDETLLEISDMLKIVNQHFPLGGPEYSSIVCTVYCMFQMRDRKGWQIDILPHYKLAVSQIS